ncbi:MAG TPA: hypothetical protein VFT31_12180 [Kribbella sp.]|nr:hypothetical protein [Kribbella sp.]
MTVRSRSVTAVAVLTVVLGAAGCGAEADPQTAGAQTTSSATTPPKAPKQVAHLSTASFLPALKGSMGAKKSVRMTMRMEAAGKVGTITAIQTLNKKPVAMAMDLSGELFGGKGRMLLVNSKIYVSMKGLAPTGKYIKVDPKDSSDPRAAQFSEMLESADPAKTFDAFDAALQQVKYVRTETIDGQRLERYAVALDAAAALRAQGQKMPAGMPKKLDYTIWLDTKHLMRRLTFDLPGVTTVITMSDWGKPVAIKAPSADDIVG